jgi:hypothetical protein
LYSVSPELAAAIESGDRVVDAALTVDWDGDAGSTGIDNLTALVTGYSLDRAVVGDLPEAVRLKQGSSAAQANVAVGKGPVLQPAGAIGPRIGSTTATANGASAVPYAIATAPDAVVRNDLMISAVSWSTTSGSNLPYAVAQDFMDGSGLPADAGWTARIADTNDVSIRTVIDSRRASDADVTWGDQGAVYGYGLSDVGVFSSIIIAIGPTASARPGVWKVDQSQVKSVPITVAGTSHTAPAVTVTTPGTILVSVWAARVTGSVTWTKDASDTEYEEVRGTNATANVALMVAYSGPLQPGTYTRTATSSASVSAGTMTVIPVVPVQGTDERHSAAWYLSPLNDASALGGKDLANVKATLSARFVTTAGPQTVPRLTGGTVRGITVNAAGRNANLAILDRREELRKAVLLPTLDYRRMGCNATWLITQALHACGLQPSPPPPGIRLISEPGEPPLYTSDARLAYTLHGSLARSYNLQWFNSGSVVGPPMGFYTVVAGDTFDTFAEPQFVAGPFGALAAYGYATDPTHHGKVIDQPVSFSGRNLVSGGAAYGRVTCWLRADPAGTGVPELFYAMMFGAYSGGNYHVGVRVRGNRQMNFWIYNDTTATFLVTVNGPNLPADGQWHHVGFGWDIEGVLGAPAAWFRIDDTTTQTPFSPPAWASAAESGDYEWAARLPISDLVAVGVLPTQPWPNETFAQDAFVDPSRLDLRFNLERTPREAWDLITDIARAEGAVVHVDEDGHFRYRTRDRYLADQMQTTQLTLTAARNIVEIKAEHAVDVVANMVSASYAEPYGVSDWTTNLTDPVRLPPNTQFNFLPVVTDDVALNLDSSIAVVAAAPASGSYAIANTLPDGSGSAVTTNITVTVSQVTADGRITLQLANNNGIVVWVTELRLWGNLVRTRAAASVVEMDRASIGRFGQQPLSLGSSQWVQSEQTARLTARNVVVDLAYPQTMLTELAVRSDPRLQLLDRVRVVDKQGVAVDSDFWITGIRESQGSGGYTMRVDARAALPVARWDTPFVWGQAMWAG